MVSNTREEKPGVSRRGILRGLGLGAAGAAAGAAAAGALMREADAASTKQAASAPRSGGYRESDHVRRVYELARF